MKTRNILTSVLVLLLPVSGDSASFVVSSGQSLQTAINNAAAGDNITVMTGSYNENITINKGIDIRGSGGSVLVTGTLTVSSAALPVYLANLTLGKAGATGITVTNSTDVRIDSCTLANAGDLNVSNSKIYCYKNTLTGNANFSSSSNWTFQRCTLAGNVSSANSTAKCIGSSMNGLNHNAGELTVFQSTMYSVDAIMAAGTSSWVCYNTLQWVQLQGGTNQVVGNWFDGRDRGDFFVNLGGGAITTIRNNFLFNDNRNQVSTSSSYVNGTSITFSFGGASAIRIQANAGQTKVLNNTISDICQGIEVIGSPAGVEIRGNIHTGVAKCPNWSVNTTYAGVVIADNNFRYGIIGGVQTNNISADPLFGASFVLGATSPSKNKGPADAIYNNFDGSRNDQGAYGGHSYDPNGRTTTKPVVLSGDVSPLYVKRGQAVTITARAAVIANP
jgi:nitrous oxidase accessory protein NosD